jgi:hypothetical protein
MSNQGSTPPVVNVGQGGYTVGVYDVNRNWTPETGALDGFYCGANQPADLLGISVTQNLSKPYPTNCWLSQVLRPPASIQQGAFYALPLGFQPFTRAGIGGINIMAPGYYSVTGNFNPGKLGPVSIFAFTVIPGVTSDMSTAIYDELQTNGFISTSGMVTSAFTPDAPGFSLNLSSQYAQYQPQIIAVLTEYADAATINYLYNPAVQALWQVNADTFMVFPKGATWGMTTQQFTRLLIDKYSDWSADLIAYNWTADQAGTDFNFDSPYIKLTPVRGSAFVYFLLNQMDIEFFVLATQAPNPVLIYSKNDTADPSNQFPAYHYFGVVFDNQFWGFFQPQGCAFGFEATTSSGTLIPNALPGSFLISTQTLNASPALPQGYFALALLPWADDATDRQNILDTFAEQYAYNFVTDTTASWQVSDSFQVSTTFAATIQNMDSTTTGGKTLLGTLPHHYNNGALQQVDGEPFSAASGFLYAYPIGPRGVIQMAEGASFEVQYQYSGVLPWLPSGIGQGGAGSQSDLTPYLQNYYELHGEQSSGSPPWPQGPPWTEGMWSTTDDASQLYYPTAPKDTYGSGKQFNKLMGYCIAAQAAGESSWFNGAFSALESYLEEWLTPTTTYPDDYLPSTAMGWPQDQCPFYYFAYDANYSTLLGFPQSYGSTSCINDHHFHYGYFLHAAAYIALFDSNFVANYGGMIDLLAADIANTPAIQQNVVQAAVPDDPPQFTMLRYWDFYEAHPWATGYQAPNPMGIQNESSSEAMNAWAGMILWGQIANRPDITRAGIFLFTSHAASINQYHFNVNAQFELADGQVTFQSYGNFVQGFVDFQGEVFDQVLQQSVSAQNLGWMTAVRVFSSGYTSDTDWQQYPTYRYTINWLPVTAASLYLGQYPEYVQAAFVQMQNEAYVESTPQVVPNYPANTITAGQYWPQYVTFPYTWGTIALPYLAIGVGNATFDFPAGGASAPESSTVLAMFQSWSAQAEQQAVSIYGQNAPSYIADYQAAPISFQETGTTVAEAYYNIASLATYGVPVFDYHPEYSTGTAFQQGAATAFYAVIKNTSTGEITFWVYNPSTTPFTVTFKDSSGNTVSSVAAAAQSLSQSVVS